MKRNFALSVVVVACASCTTPESVENAGLSDWRIDFEDGKPKSVRIIDGKEKADVTFEVDLNAGKASYSASDVRAFDGQKFAADVAKVQANEQGQTIREIAPGAIDGIVDLVRTYLSGS